MNKKQIEYSHFIDTLVGWTKGGSIYKTIDGGKNWIRLAGRYLSKSPKISAVWFHDSSTGWGISDTGRIWRTFTSGRNWVLHTQVKPEKLNDIHFTKSGQGWIVGNNGLLLNLDKDLKKWKIVDSRLSGELRTINFENEKLGWITGDKGYLWRSKDSGMTWIPQLLDPDLFYKRPGQNMIIGYKKKYGYGERKGYCLFNKKELKKKGSLEIHTFDKISRKSIASVQININSKFGSLCLASDEKGKVKMALPCGQYALIARHPDYKNSNVSLPIRENSAIYIDIGLLPLPNDITNPQLGKSLNFELLGIYPNPFNSSTNIRFHIGTPSSIHFAIYDLRGRLVRNIYLPPIAAGQHILNWDGLTEKAGPATSGVYFYRVKCNQGSAKGQMVLIR